MFTADVTNNTRYPFVETISWVVIAPGQTVSVSVPSFDALTANIEQWNDIYGFEGITAVQTGGETESIGGWTPILALVADGSRYVMQVVDWMYGSGEKPDTGVYIGASGFVVDIADGVNVRGASGDAGAAGLQGDPGPAGADGAPGADGAQGDPGPAGADGASAYEVAAANGFIGNEAAWLASLVGATGPTGATGPQGPTGATGATGTAATIAVGTVTTGSAGSSASVTNSGTSSAAVFDFTIPRGDTGAAGAGGAVTISGKTGAYTVVAGDLGSVINCTANTFTVSLTAAATLGAGFQCWVWNTSNTATHVITIDPNSTETIDGATTLILRRGEGVQIVCDGTNWQTAGTKKQRLYSENAANNVTRAAVTGSNAVGIGNAAVVSATSAVGIGDGATATGTSSVVIGTGRATTQDSVAIAITDNTTSYGAGTNTSAIAVGSLARVLGSQSCVMGGGGNSTSSAGSNSGILAGSNNTISAANSGVVGGNALTISGSHSGAIGGNSCDVSGGYGAVLGGYYTSSNVVGKVATGCYQVYSLGACQQGVTVVYATTTNNTATRLKSDTSAAGATNQLVLSNNQSMSFKGQCVAQRKGSESTTSTAAWEFSGVIRRGANAASTALVAAVTPTLIAADADAAAWTIAVTADTTNGALAVTVTGEAAKNIRWVCTLESTETIYS